MEDSKTKFLLKMYDSVWVSVRNRENTIIKYWGIVISAIGLIGYSLHNDLKYLFLTSIISELFILWGILLLIEANFEYRRGQKMMSNIEIALMDNAIYNFIPKKYHKVKDEFIGIYKIHITVFILLYILIPFHFIYRSILSNGCHSLFLYAIQNQFSSCCFLLKGNIIFFVMIAGVEIIVYYWLTRKHKIKKFIDEVDKNNQNSNQ